MEFITPIIALYCLVISGVLGSLAKALPIYLNKEQRHRLTDPLYLIGMGIVALFSILLLFLDIQLLWLSLGCLAFANWALLRFTDEDYNVEDGVKNAFRVAKKCPHCMKSLPSYLTSKCPHCTADL